MKFKIFAAFLTINLLSSLAQAEERKCLNGSTIRYGENAAIYLNKKPPFVKKNADGQVIYTCCDANGQAQEYYSESEKNKNCFSVGVPVENSSDDADKS